MRSSVFRNDLGCVRLAGVGALGCFAGCLVVELLDLPVVVGLPVSEAVLVVGQRVGGDCLGSRTSRSDQQVDVSDLVTVADERLSYQDAVLGHAVPPVNKCWMCQTAVGSRRRDSGRARRGLADCRTIEYLTCFVPISGVCRKATDSCRLEIPRRTTSRPSDPHSCPAWLVAAFCRNQPFASLSTPRASRVRCARLTPAHDPPDHPLGI